MLALVLCAKPQVKAQQVPMFSQYQVNMLAVNPAYAGSKESIHALLHFRKQWTGIEGTPQNESFAFHMPVSDDKFGIGLNLVNDQLGVSRTTNVYLAGAYRMEFGKHSLAAGMQFGASIHNNEWSAINTIDAGDPSFTGGDESFTNGNTGVGLWYYNTDNWFSGLSMPFVINHVYDNVNSEVEAIQKRHLFFTVGKVFDISHDLKIKPWIMAKKVENVSMQFDLNASLIFNDNFLVGGQLRSGDGLAAMIQYSFAAGFWAGYSYDYPLTEIRQFTGGSHELFVSYTRQIKRPKVMSPRYF